MGRPRKLGDELANGVTAARGMLVVPRPCGSSSEELPQLVEVGVDMQRELGGPIERYEVLQRQLFGDLSPRSPPHQSSPPRTYASPARGSMVPYVAGSGYRPCVGDPAEKVGATFEGVVPPGPHGQGELENTSYCFSLSR